MFKDVELRRRIADARHWTKAEILELKSLVNTMTNDELCKHFDTSLISLTTAFRKFRVKRDEETVKEMRSRSKQGEANHNWKGGISKDHARYLTIQRKRYPEHKAARNAVYEALKKGTLVKPQACIDCGKEGKLEGHHESYEEDKYLDVVWICKTCHRKRHGGTH